jgi:hypothetical protein
MAEADDATLRVQVEVPEPYARLLADADTASKTVISTTTRAISPGCSVVRRHRFRRRSNARFVLASPAMA